MQRVPSPLTSTIAMAPMLPPVTVQYVSSPAVLKPWTDRSPPANTGGGTIVEAVAVAEEGSFFLEAEEDDRPRLSSSSASIPPK